MAWYAVYTKPRQEHIAQENLERQSFETYLPLMLSSRKRRGKWVEVTEPMFSRYLFIRIDPGSISIASIRSTRGVSGMVQFGNQLAAVPDGFITMLLQTADSETGLHTAHHQLLKAGDGVELTAGPLASLRGILKARDGTARAIVLLNILGTVAEVAVPVERLRRAS